MCRFQCEWWGPRSLALNLRNDVVMTAWTNTMWRGDTGLAGLGHRQAALACWDVCTRHSATILWWSPRNPLRGTRPTARATFSGTHK